jgi:competence protein ComEC
MDRFDRMPAVRILVPFALGIAAAGLIGMPLAPSVVSGLSMAVLSLLARKRGRFSAICLSTAIFFLGAACLANSRTIPPGHIAGLLGDRPVSMILRGTVADDPSVETARFGQTRISFLLRVDSVKSGGGWAASQGLVETSVYSRSPLRLNYGERIMLAGAVMRPSGLKNPGLFDYERHLARKRIYAMMRVRPGSPVRVISGMPADPARRLAYRVRAFIRSTFDTYLDAPYRDLAKAMLIGERSGLGHGLNEDFMKTGTIHILSISGLHVGLIAAIVFAVFGLLRIPKKLNFALTAALLYLYVFVAGASPPIIRAVVMFSIFAIGYISERDAPPLNSLAFAAFLMLIWNPDELFDTSFLLSFGSLASIFIFAPSIEGLLRAGRDPGAGLRQRSAAYLVKGVSVSAAAWIGTWPVIAANFNIVSLVSVLANLVIIPMSFVSMIMSIAILCAAPVSAEAANLAAHILSMFDAALFRVNHFLASLPIGWFRVAAPSAIQSVLYYVILALWIMPTGASRPGRLRRARTAALIAALAVLDLTVWKELAAPPGKALEVSFLDVGAGDAALIRFPDGSNMLVDAGAGGGDKGFDAGRRIVAPYLWNKGIGSIDALLVTHPHADHLGGAVYILNNFRVGVVMDSGAPAEGALVDEYLGSMKKGRVRRVAVGDGDAFGMSGARIRILNPERPAAPQDHNSGSVVMRISYGGGDLLFCSDIDARAMERIIAKYGSSIRSDIVKAPHHGGSTGDNATTRRFYEAVSPSVAVVSAGRSARRSAAHMKYILSTASTVYDTAVNGAVIAVIDASGCSVKPYKKIY